jgi:hypothetical protein
MVSSLTTFKKTFPTAARSRSKVVVNVNSPTRPPVSVLIACTTGKPAPECLWPHYSLALLGF